jgi:hypothetical protein
LPAIAAATALTAALPFMVTLPGRAVAVGVFAVAVVVDVADRTLDHVWEWQISGSERGAGILAAVVAVLVIGGLVALVTVQPDRRLAVGAGIGVLLVAILGGWWLQRDYLHDRYALPDTATAAAADVQGAPAAPAWAWAQGLAPTRIGITGDLLQYPYTGGALANRVRYIGVETDDGGFREAHTCREWRAAIAAGRFRYVAVSPQVFQPTRRRVDELERWTTTVPGTTRVFHDDHTDVYRLTRSPDPDACQ